MYNVGSLLKGCLWTGESELPELPVTAVEHIRQWNTYSNTYQSRGKTTGSGTHTPTGAAGDFAKQMMKRCWEQQPENRPSSCTSDDGPVDPETGARTLNYLAREEIWPEAPPHFKTVWPEKRQLKTICREEFQNCLAREETTHLQVGWQQNNINQHINVRTTPVCMDQMSKRVQKESTVMTRREREGNASSREGNASPSRDKTK